MCLLSAPAMALRADGAATKRAMVHSLLRPRLFLHPPRGGLGADPSQEQTKAFGKHTDDRETARRWLLFHMTFTLRAVCDRSWAFFISIMLSSRVGSLVYLLRTAIQISFGLVSCRQSWEWLSLRKTEHVAWLFMVQQVSLLVVAIQLYMLEKGSAAMPMVLLLGIFSGMEMISSRHFKRVKEKKDVYDLVTRDAQGKQQEISSRLAAANSLLTRIDLLVACLCPLAINFSMSVLDRLGTMALLVALQLMSVLLLSFAPSSDVSLAGQPSPSMSVKQQGDKGGGAAAGSLKLRVLVLAYGLLYFTVVTPGGLFNMYMREEGLDVRLLGYFGSLAQVCGVLATFAVPVAARRLGMYPCALFFSLFQAACVAGVALLAARGELPLAMCLCAMSRFGLWGFDLSHRTLVQVQSDARLGLFLLEASLAETFSIAIFTASAISKSFRFLCQVSAVATCSSSALVLLSALLPSGSSSSRSM
ncbi:hypothetical protein GUITHDRAFT_112119 [Guillardia theta CCMP2712]|uniref:Solute carrier family 40 member n=1 Tax=Guillardia theta (strain CCMP2712) TaxID=905079 RepID=L1J0T7_GUITC|nr:hypothetical protein GUITHDRAFT_112119 [Guillardia theta CCMP2712]EKX41705.1 hypothetical protein GUITHDRAFT_112119 [Guillardia theta CCMP2712]|eukprot:XP_005828685.1 hypothetical protein GUITHDRAFT_112119 [Guillardia theta CCMP2712]